jgi:hypothetical protein
VLLTALVFGRFCLGSNGDFLRHGKRDFANWALPWTHGWLSCRPDELSGLAKVDRLCWNLDLSSRVGCPVTSEMKSLYTHPLGLSRPLFRR